MTEFPVALRRGVCAGEPPGVRRFAGDACATVVGRERTGRPFVTGFDIVTPFEFGKAIRPAVGLSRDAACRCVQNAAYSVFLRGGFVSGVPHAAAAFQWPEGFSQYRRAIETSWGAAPGGKVMRTRPASRRSRLCRSCVATCPAHTCTQSRTPRRLRAYPLPAFPPPHVQLPKRRCRRSQLRCRSRNSDSADRWFLWRRLPAIHD